MRTVTLTLYKFDELPTDDAKEKAREWGRRVISGDPAWAEESRDSIEKFCEEFNIKLRAWSVDAWNFDFDFGGYGNENFRGLKLKNYPRDMMPTGYWLDSVLYAKFHDEWKRTGDPKEAFYSAVWEGFKAWRDDLESQMEDEYIDDFLTVNEFEFTEEGEEV